MAEFAQVDVNGIVTNTVSVADGVLGGLEFPDSEAVGQEFLASLGMTGEFRQYSLVGKYRGKFPKVGDFYDPKTDEFITVQVEV